MKEVIGFGLSSSGEIIFVYSILNMENSCILQAV